MRKPTCIKIIAVFLLLCTLALTFASCKGDSSDTGESDNAQTADGAVGTEEKKYEFPDVNLEGKTYKILNCTRDMWNMIGYITATGVNGDEINDAAYARTVWLQENLNCTLEEVNIDIYALKDTLNTDVMSGTWEYAAAYQRADQTLAGIIDGTHGSLDTISSLKLGEDYWAQDLMTATSLMGKHYFAVSDLQLMSFDGAWCTFFNVELLEDSGIEAPYDMVRNGTWTVEELQKICRQVANLNGDDTYDFNVEGNSVYGYTTFIDGVAKFLFGIEALYADKDVTDIPYLACTTPDFYNKSQKLGGFISEAGTYFYADPGGDKGYDTLFLEGRAVFVGAEIQLTGKMRAIDLDYGILPFPKYDAQQTEYHTTVLNMLPVLTISEGYDKKEDIGLIMDALSFEAARTLEDIYYNRRLSLKNNTGEMEDDVDMLNILRETRSFDIFVVLGVSETLRNEVIWSVAEGASDIVSTVAEYKGGAETQLAKLKIFLQKQA